MNVRKAIKILVRYRTIKEDTEAAEKSYKELCDWLDWVASIPSPVQRMTGMPGSGQPSQMTEDYALRRLRLGEEHLDELNRRNNKVNDLIRFKFKVEDALLLCTAQEEEIVTKRWLKKERMVEIAEDLSISTVTAYRYQWRAFDKIEEVFMDENVEAFVNVSELDDEERKRME